jgi:membrane protease YdiL (CAAX protease family)
MPADDQPDPDPADSPADPEAAGSQADSEAAGPPADSELAGPPPEPSAASSAGAEDSDPAPDSADPVNSGPPTGPPSAPANPFAGMPAAQPVEPVETTAIPGNPTFAAQPYPGPPAGLPWGFLGFFTGYGGFYLVSLIITGAVAAVAIHPDAIQSHLRGPVVLLALLPNLMLGLGPAVLSWWRGNGPRRGFGIRFTRTDLATGLSCGVIALAGGLAINLILQALVFHTPQQGVAQQLGELSGGRSGWLVVALLYVVLVAPLNEEMLMRGALWGALEHYRLPKLMILGLTALVFALLHQEPTLTVALFAQGVAIGVARMRTGGIGASMIAHATNNFLPAVVLWFASKP